MKSKLAVGLNTYNDTPGVRRCIDSLYEHVDLVIVVDGKYNDWGKPNDHLPGLSTDGLADLLGQYEKHKIFLAEAPNQPQTLKRTRYLEIAGQFECTHLLVIDADEYIDPAATDWNLFRDHLDNDQRFEHNLGNLVTKIDKFGIPQYCYNILYEAQPDRNVLLTRLIYRPGELEYGNHWLLNRKHDGCPVAYRLGADGIDMGDPCAVPGIKIVTNDLTRPNERLHQDIDYQWDLFLKEGIISEEKHANPWEKKAFATHIIWECEVWRKNVGKSEFGDKMSPNRSQKQEQA